MSKFVSSDSLRSKHFRRLKYISNKSSLFPFSPTFFSYEAQAFVTIVLFCDCTLCGPKTWLIVNIGNLGSTGETFDNSRATRLGDLAMCFAMKVAVSSQEKLT